MNATHSEKTGGIVLIELKNKVWLLICENLPVKGLLSNNWFDNSNFDTNDTNPQFDILNQLYLY